MRPEGPAQRMEVPHLRRSSYMQSLPGLTAGPIHCRPFGPHRRRAIICDARYSGSSALPQSLGEMIGPASKTERLRRLVLDEVNSVISPIQARCQFLRNAQKLKFAQLDNARAKVIQVPLAQPECSERTKCHGKRIPFVDYRCLPYCRSLRRVHAKGRPAQHHNNEPRRPASSNTAGAPGGSS